MPVSKKEALGMLACSACIAASDQLIKWAIKGFASGSVIASFPPFFDIVRSDNSGAAFSILSGRGALLLIATSVLLAILLLGMLFYRGLSKTARWTIAVLLGGGAGNWIDRLLDGTVCDYIRLLFIRFPVFNLADIMITGSVIWLIVLLLAGRLELNTGEANGTGH